MSEYINVSRRTFLKGTAAVAGAALAGGAYEIVHPEGAVAEEAPIEVKNTYCDMCNHVPKCGIAASVKDGKVVRVEARDKYPADPICAKGISSLQELYDPHRITYPMVRTNRRARVRPNGSPSPGTTRTRASPASSTASKKRAVPKRCCSTAATRRSRAALCSAWPRCSARPRTAQKAPPARRPRGSARSW